MKKILTSVVLFAAGLFAVNAQQLKTGDTFEYTNADGVLKTYTVVGENLIENPSFDNNTTGWVGGAGGSLTGVDWHSNGGVDDGAYLRLTENAGKGGNGSIGTAWALEKGKTYVFSYFIRQNTDVNAVAKEGYIVTSETNTPRGDETKTIMYGYEDANCAWTQNIVVTTAEYDYLQFCARWLGGSKCFDAFILAEVSEAADPAELETLLANCQEWIDTFGDEAKGLDAFDPVVKEAQDLVDGEEYTAEELNAMVHKLNEALLDFRMANASDDYTVDVTNRYLTNPNFDNGLSGWTRNNDAVNGGSNIRFFEYFGESSRVLEINEGSSAVSKDTHVSQTIYNLPLGYYRFTVQCVMNHAVDKTADPEAKSGAAIYCNGAELDMVTEQITTDGASKDNSYPQTFTIEGVVSADSIIVGLVGYQENNFTYVAIDNVKLEYAGFDAYVYISGLIDNIYSWIGDNGEFLLPGITYNLEDEIGLAEDAEEEEMNAAYIRLDSVFNAAKQSIELVQQLAKDYEDFANYVNETGYPGTDAAITVIDEIATFLELEDENAGYAELYAMIAKLDQAIADYRMSQVATKEEPADYTFLLPNANFEEKGNWVWNLTHNGGGSDLWIGNCRPIMEGGENRQGVNLWGNHIVSIDLHQELTGLPNGLYSISAEMITQGETADHGDYTTDQHLYVTGINTSVSENLPAPGGWDFYQWSTLQTGYVVVINGKLTVGAASSKGGDASEGWFQATNFKLYYHGEATDADLQVAYEATIAEAQALLPNMLKGDAAVLQAKINEAIALSATSYGEASALLVEPISAAKTAVQTYNSYKTGAYQNAIDKMDPEKEGALATEEALALIDTAIKFADAITAADTTTTVALTAIQEKLNAYSDYATYLEEVSYMLTDRSAGYAASNIKDVEATIAAQKADLTAEFQNKTNVENLKTKLQNVVSYLIKSSYMNAKAGDDVTALIVNPTFDSDAAGWIVNKGTGNTETNASQHWGADAANRYMDSYNGTKKALNFRGSQVLTNIPNGTYTVTVATRADSIGAYIFALGEAITDTLVNDSTVMLQVANSANTKWQEIEFHADSLGGIWQAEEDKWQAGSTYDETLHNANNGKGFGWTWATIDDIVVTNHAMVIGVTTDSTVTKKAGFEGKWFSVDDWSLTLKAVGDNNGWTIESGIENVAAVVTKTVYYAIDGRQLAVPGKGVNIVKTVYSDGRIEVKKVFVK